ncbi:MAG TPA: helix-turn-helix transcriptional regulator [Polyangiaceae bacterium]|jgi:AraC-like DNA-binding protein|nr:helix-turn-helix transcriptional regulator [Polyangiaceae bacterium]
MSIRSVPADLDLTSSVQRGAPRHAPLRTRLQPLPLDQVNPVIRIAHRLRGLLDVPERMIVDHELVLFLAGSGQISFREQSLRFTAHDLLFIEPFVPHAVQSTGSCEHIAVHFDFGPRAASEAELERRRPYAIRLAGARELPLRQRIAQHGAIEHSLRELVTHFARGTPEGRTRARGELLCTLAALLTQATKPRGEAGRRRAKLEQTIATMRARLAEPLSSADLRRVSGLASSQLHALFRELTGYAPMDYLRRLRIQTARALLADPKLSIKEVAARTGFDDPYHFSRVFSRVDGVPPSAYRDALLTGKPSIRS